MATLQAALTGALLGGLWAMMAVGLSVSWGMLRVINLAHFGMILLGGYLTVELATTWHIDPLLTIAVTAPLMFGLGAGLQWVYERTGLVEFTSLLVSFGVLIIIVQLVHNQWTADFIRMPPAANRYGTRSWFLGNLAFPLPSLLAFGFGVLLIGGAAVALRTTFAGRAVRAFAEDREIAAAYGIHHRRLGMLLAGGCGASAAVAGTLFALGNTLTPDRAFEWIGIVFAVVILGGIGQVVGTLTAGVLVGMLAGVSAVIWESTASLLVVFLVIVLALLLRPHGLLVRGAFR